MSRLEYVLSAAWQGFWRNPVMSVASTLTVAVMLLLGAFFVMTDRGLQAAVGILESKVELIVYLEDDAKPSDVLELRRRVEADPAVDAVVYVSKDEALQRLKEIAARRPELAIETVSTNPLPNTLEVKLRSAQETRRVSGLLREEVGRGIVYDLVDNPTVVDKLLTITSVLSVGGLVVLGMMLFVALFVIVNTIRIAVHARRDEIEIMKLVGATDWFVRWPFIVEGMLVGAFGAFVALAAIGAAAGPVSSALIGFLDIVPVSLGANFMIQLAGSVLGFALLVGAGGAMLSVRTHLAK
jgi:cell division transport system permease protein